MNNFKSIALVFLLQILAVYGQNTPINYGETKTGSISTVGEVDIFSFSGSINDKIIIRLTDNSYASYLDPKMELFTSNGIVIAAASNTTQAEIKLTLPANDNYMIFVSDQGTNNTGNYSLFVQKTLNPGNASILDYGQTLSKSISVVGEVDTYTFDGLLGEKILIRMTDNSYAKYLEPLIELFSPSGDSLTLTWDNSQAEITLSLPIDGTYTIFTSDLYPGDDTGTYGLYIQRKSDPKNDSLLVYGQTISSTINSVGDVDTYTFWATNGDSVIIRMTDNSYAHYLEPFIELYAPSGDLLISDWDTDQAEIALRMNEYGKYSIFASDYYPGDDTGDYDVFIFGFPNSNPVLSINTTFLNFGNALIGETLTDTVIVRNIGGNTLNINSISISGENLSDFNVDTTQFNLGSGESKFLPVTFSPNVLGNFSASLNIQSNGGDVIVSLIGTGIQGTNNRLVMIPDTSGLPDSDILIPIRISDATGLAGAEIRLTFDSNILTADTVETANTLSQNFGVSSASSAGKFVISMARAEGLTGGSGDLIKVKFNVTGSGGDTTTIKIDSLALYDENLNTISSTNQNGLFTAGGTITDEIFIVPDGDTLTALNSDQIFTVYGITIQDDTVDVSARWELINNFGAIGTATPDSAQTCTFTATGTGDGYLVATMKTKSKTLTDSALVIVGLMRGDINMDTKISVPDAIRCLQIDVSLTDLFNPTPYSLWAADFNEDDSINVADAIGILDTAVTNLLDLKILFANPAYRPSNGAAIVKLGAPQPQSNGTVLIPLLTENRFDICGTDLTVEFDELSYKLVNIFSARSSSLIAKNPEKAKAATINTGGLVNSKGEILWLRFKTLNADSELPSVSIKNINLCDRKGNRIEASIETYREEVEVAVIPEEFNLHQNYPNPFNPATRIEFALPAAGQVQLAVYNVSGQLVKNLVNGNINAGVHSITWDGRDAQNQQVASGIYFYRIDIDNGSFRQIRKMILMK